MFIFSRGLNQMEGVCVCVCAGVGVAVCCWV